MKIQTEARLILTVPLNTKDDNAMEIMQQAEQHINNVAAIFTMPKTKTKVGVRLLTDWKGTKVIE